MCHFCEVSVCLTVCHSFHTSLHCSFLLSHLYFSTVTVSRPDCKLLHTGTAYILCVSVYNVYYNRPSTEWEIKPVTFVCHTLQVKPISSKLYPTTSTFHRPLEAKKKKYIKTSSKTLGKIPIGGHVQFPLNPSDFGRLNKSFSKGVMNSLVAEISHKVSCNEFGIWDIWGKLHGCQGPLYCQYR